MNKWNLWLHKQFKIHNWVYTNPYDRTCQICRQRENEFVIVYGGENPLYKNGHWEQVYPLPAPAESETTK